MAHDTFEVALSRFTFNGAELLAQEMVTGLRQVSHPELLDLIGAYQLRFIQATLHQGKALAIGSGNLAPAQSETRHYNAMIILSVDDLRPVEADAELIASKGSLELRERLMDPSAASTSNANPRVA